VKPNKLLDANSKLPACWDACNRHAAGNITTRRVTVPHADSKQHENSQNFGRIRPLQTTKSRSNQNENPEYAAGWQESRREMREKQRTRSEGA
jgi:hypothetical protein